MAGTVAGTQLSWVKHALKQVHDLLGGSLPKGEPGKWGSPQRGTPKTGYRLDGPHSGPNHPGGKGPHIDYWDYSKGKRGVGGVSGSIPILPPIIIFSVFSPEQMMQMILNPHMQGVPSEL